MLKCFLLILSTGAHSPSMISQGRIGALVTAKPTDRRAILEEAAGYQACMLEDTKLNLDWVLQKIILKELMNLEDNKRNN
jgi:chromosome segregation ATPase